MSPSCLSVSSVSSQESCSPKPLTGPPQNMCYSPLPTIQGPLSTPPSITTTAAPGTLSLHRTSRPIIIRKGVQGYGFTIRSVRVYLSQDSDYYTIEHIVAAVKSNSPAWEAGLRIDDLITHIHTQPVHNMTHPQLMHRLLAGGGGASAGSINNSNGEIILHVVALNSTSIREGEARRQVGQLLKKRPRRPGGGGQRRSGAVGTALEKKQHRKTSALLRRLSGKRTAGDIVPGKIFSSFNFFNFLSVLFYNYFLTFITFFLFDLKSFSTQIS